MADEEKSYRKLAEQYERVLEDADQNFWDWNLKTNMIRVSLGFEALLGYRHGELPGNDGGSILMPTEDWATHVHPDDFRKAWESIERHLKGITPYHEIELRCRTKSGEWKWLLVKGQVVGRDGNGTPLIMSGTHTDISKRKQDQQAIFALLERFRIALSNSQVTVFEQDLELRYTYNHRPYFGYLPEQVIGKRDRDLINPENAAELEALKQTVIDTGLPVRKEVRIEARNGQLKFSDIYIEPRHDEAGKIAGIICTSVDITERKHAEEHIRESEERFRALVDSAADAYFVHDISGKILEVNKMACESLGYIREELLQMSVFDVDADFKPKFAQDVWSQPAGGSVITLQGRHRRKDGTLFPVEVRISSISMGGRSVFLALARDITERIQAEEAQKLAAKVYQDSSEAMVVLDEDYKIIMVNQAFVDITGYKADEVTGKDPSFLKVDHLDSPNYDNLRKQVSKTGQFKGDIWQRKKDGQIFAGQLTINAILGESDTPHRYVALLSDITEKKRFDDLIWSQANFDTLTGLPNRRFFRDRLEHDVRNARRSKLPLALLFIDLDGFKDVNDTLGHDMGDLLLKEAADRLYRCVRESDTVARLGGDEFTVILTELHNPRNVDRIARHILHELSEPITLGKDVAYVSGSIGVTLFPNDATEVEELIRNADQAMYAAKQSGKNQYHYFTQSMQEEAQRKMRIINDLRGALDSKQFEIVYQPIVELTSGSIHKAEALIRWRHPKKGLLSPIQFISAAEDTGLISDFGDWVFREATKQAAVWRDKYHPEFQVSVNISPAQFKKEGIDPSIWFEHLKNLGLPGKGIVVEITEGLLLEASIKVQDQLLMLRDAGIEVALDDFGTGYSSLSYLKKFDIDYIKIDQVFVHNLEPESDDVALCEAIIVMAHKLGLKVIAEGIETKSQCNLLVAAGCDYGQGYLFSRPVTSTELDKILATAMGMP